MCKRRPRSRSRPHHTEEPPHVRSADRPSYRPCPRLVRRAGLHRLLGAGRAGEVRCGDAPRRRCRRLHPPRCPCSPMRRMARRSRAPCSSSPSGPRRSPRTTPDFAVVVGTASTHLVMFKGTSIPFLKLDLPVEDAVFYDGNGVALPAGTKVAVQDADRSGERRRPLRPARHELRRAFGEGLAQLLRTRSRRPPRGPLAIWYQPDDMTAWTSRQRSSTWSSGG